MTSLQYLFYGTNKGHTIIFLIFLKYANIRLIILIFSQSTNPQSPILSPSYRTSSMAYFRKNRDVPSFTKKRIWQYNIYNQTYFMCYSKGVTPDSKTCYKVAIRQAVANSKQPRQDIRHVPATSGRRPPPSPPPSPKVPSWTNSEAPSSLRASLSQSTGDVWGEGLLGNCGYVLYRPDILTYWFHSQSFFQIRRILISRFFWHRRWNGIVTNAEKIWANGRWAGHRWFVWVPTNWHGRDKPTQSVLSRHVRRVRAHGMGGTGFASPSRISDSR